MRRLPWVWIVDDSLSMFYQLRPIVDITGAPPELNPSGATRLKQREAPDNTPMFLAALLAVQRHTFMLKAAVAGFLRDDGTAVCKRLDWKKDELSLYKVILLNLPKLKRLGVEYQRGLLMYEDICLNHDVLQSGGHTLKCQSYCFRAIQRRGGGCAEQRESTLERTGTKLEDLMALTDFQGLDASRQQAVNQILEWVQSKEAWSVRRSNAMETQQVGEVAQPRQLTDEQKRKRREYNQKRDFKAEYRRRKARRLAQKALQGDSQAASNKATVITPPPGDGAASPSSPSSSSVSSSSALDSDSDSSEGDGTMNGILKHALMSDDSDA